MTVERNYYKGYVNFSAIDFGETFLYNDNVYVVCPPVLSVLDNDDEYNVFCLDTATFDYIYEDTQVQRINVKVVEI